MELNEKRSLSKVRYDHALECLDAAKSLLENGNFKSAANRSYHAVFHAMRAVLVFDEVDMKHTTAALSLNSAGAISRQGFLKQDFHRSSLCCLIPERTVITMISL